MSLFGIGRLENTWPTFHYTLACPAILYLTGVISCPLSIHTCHSSAQGIAVCFQLTTLPSVAGGACSCSYHFLLEFPNPTESYFTQLHVNTPPSNPPDAPHSGWFHADPQSKLWALQISPSMGPWWRSLSTRYMCHRACSYPTSQPTRRCRLAVGHCHGAVGRMGPRTHASSHGADGVPTSKTVFTASTNCAACMHSKGHLSSSTGASSASWTITQDASLAHSPRMARAPVRARPSQV
ncbi:hypothetical protein BJV78DRAFT_1193557, partial [Lactifluus subvellereus]